MNFKQWMWASALLASIPVAAEQASQSATTGRAESVMTMRVDGELAIDTQGQVLDYRIDTKLQPELQQLIAKAVPSWLFWPVVIDGKPVAAKTNMRITLAARPVDTGYAIKVDNVTFRTESASPPDPRLYKDTVSITSKSMKPPGYPKGLQQAGAEGMVLLYLKINLDGKVDQVTAAQSSLFNIKGSAKTMETGLALLEASTVTAAKRWTFQVDPKGKAVTDEDLTISVPVLYLLAKKNINAAGLWRQEVRGPMHRAPWLHQIGDIRLAQRPGVSDFDSGEMLPLTSPFKIRDGVVGKAL